MIYGAGGIGTKALAFILLPVYLRFLTPEDYGILAIASIVSSVVAILLGMGLQSGVIRHYYDSIDEPEEVRKYLATVVLFFVAVGTVVTSMLSVFGRPLFDLALSEVAFYPYLVLALWIGFFAAMGNILLSVYRAREQAAAYVAIQIGKLILGLVLIIFFVVVLHHGALGKLQGGFLAGLAFFLLFAILTLRETGARLQFSKSKLVYGLRFGLPLVPHRLFGFVLAAADRILLERLMSLSEVGLYTLGYQIGMVMSLVISAINYAWTPIFYDTAKNDPNAKSILSRIFTLYTVVVSTLAVGVILFSREAILIVAAKPFHEAYLVVPAVAVGYLFQGLYFMSIAPIFYKKKTYVMPFLTGIAAATNIGLNLLWIPRFGMMGAAYATLVSFALLFVLTHYFAQRYYRLPYNYRKVASMGLLVAGVYFVNNALHFQGIIVPVAIKIGILASFLAGMFFLKVVSIQELRRARELVRSAMRHDDQETCNG